MKNYSLAHLADSTLMLGYRTSAAQCSTAETTLLAHMAEVDARQLWAPAACSSMFDHAMRVMGFSEDAAGKRIQAARLARRFPRIFELIEANRLHLSGVCLLAPVLDDGNANTLLEAAAGRTCADIRELVARHAPRPDLPERLALMPGTPVASGTEALPLASPGVTAVLPEYATKHVSATVTPQRPRVTPLSEERFGLQLTIGRATRDKLRHAQALLGHVVATGPLEQVLDRALDALIEKLERRKLGATKHPRARRSDRSTRSLPSETRREVWQRDGGRCTFVSADGHRCEARSGLEFDHVQPVAQGGRATTANLRLRCRAHNQYEAERAYGAEFMRRKRETARAAAESRVRAGVT